jgi:hypothetical protein
MERGEIFYFALSAIAVSISLAACSTEATFTFSDYEPTCDPNLVQVFGDVDGDAVDITSSSYGFSGLPMWSLSLFEEGARVVMVPKSSTFAGTMPATGLFSLRSGDALHCAGEDSVVAVTETAGTVLVLRSLARVGSCPGNTPLSTNIEGCIGGIDDDCSASGGPLPEEGLAIIGHSLEGIGSAFSLQVEFENGQFLDVDSRRNNGTILYDGTIYCVGQATVADNDSGPREFVLSDLTVLGICTGQTEISGQLDVCLPE